MDQINRASFIVRLRLFAGQYQHVAGWLRGYLPNRDRNLRLEYLAGLSLDKRAEEEIYGAMTAAIRYPEGLFDLGEAEEAALRDWFDGTYSKN